MQEKKYVLKGMVEYIPGLAVLFVIGLCGKYLERGFESILNESSKVLAKDMYILFAIIVGIIVGNLVRFPSVFKKGIAMYEFFLKFGVILIGARLAVQELFTLGVIGIVLVLLEIFASILIVRLVSRKFRLSEKLSSLISIGVGICGVSAIVGCAPAIDADEKDSSYAIAIILIFGAMALVLYPAIGKLLDMTDRSFGMWAGLAVDNTAEAVATGHIYSEAAGKYATMTKLMRNALMGITILGFALYYARKGMAKAVTHKGRFLWEKFPKFVLGFVLFSILASIRLENGFVFLANEQADALKNLCKWAFMLTFAGVGLSTSIRDMGKTGFKPFAVGLTTELGVGLFTLLLILGLGFTGIL
jgi:uncharacterized integral membrane protein (TIGR00698 family)